MKTTVAHSASVSTRLTPSWKTGIGYLIHSTHHLDQCHSDSFHKYYLMNEMSARRKSGDLLKTALSVTGKVTAIHGAYDPHPVQALHVLQKQLPGFTLHTLAQCGHDPWKERYAREEFLKILVQEID